MMEVKTNKIKFPAYQFHRFLDEAGDTTFYGKGKIPIVGTVGVSRYFLLGMLSVNQPLDEVRNSIVKLQEKIINDPYFLGVPSIKSKKDTNGYFLHATDDVPEVRKMAFELINSIDCRFSAVVGKKEYGIYEKKHNGSQAEFYADMLSHLLYDSLGGSQKLVLNIAHRSRCTSHINLEKGLQKALVIAKNKFTDVLVSCETVFNIQYPTTEPIINLADYFLWALQRKIEKGESRYLDFIDHRLGDVVMLYSEDHNNN